jgi:hypothetical protein
LEKQKRSFSSVRLVLDLLFRIERSQITKQFPAKNGKKPFGVTVMVWQFKRDDRVHRFCELINFSLAGEAARWAAQHEKTTQELFALASGTEIQQLRFQDIIERVVAALEPIGEVFSDFTKWEHKKEKCWIVLVLRAVQLAIEDRLEITLKKDLTWVHAVGMGKDCGLVPVFFFGQWRRVIKVHSMRSNINLSKNSMCFIRSLYETKRCWLAMPDVFEEEAMEKHKKCMTTPAMSTSEALEFIRYVVDMVVPPISDEAYAKPPSERNAEEDRVFVPGTVLPTYSGSFETSRIKGGNHRALSHGFGRGIGIPLTPYDLKKDDLFTCDSRRGGGSSEEGHNCDLICSCSIPPVPAVVEWLETEISPERHCRRRPWDVANEYLEASSQLDNRVKYVALPEPGKYRIITKGRQSLYTGLQVLQKFLLASWKRLPIGTMVDDIETHINESMHGPRPPVGKWQRSPQDVLDQDKEMYFVSGDYSSATDLMHLDATLCAVDRICENLRIRGSRVATEFRRSFEGAYIEYPDKTTHLQVRGQLMGHPCSFPILCMINLSTYCRIYYIKTLEHLKSRRVLINGDDILFQGSLSASNQWRKFAAEVGLQINEEKTYNHRNWHLINSVLGDKRDTVPYYARSLAIGHRVKSEPVVMVRTLPALERFIARYPVERGRKRLFRFLLATIHKRLTQSDFRFKYTDKNGKGKQTGRFRRNFFLPRQLGGLGLENRTGEGYHITTAQQKLATYILRDDPGFIGFHEKIAEAPVACATAIQKIHQMKPAVELLLDSEGHHIEGPLRKNEDPTLLMDQYLNLALGSTQWLTSTPWEDDNKYRMRVMDVPIPRERNLIKKSKLRRLTPARERVVQPGPLVSDLEDRVRERNEDEYYRLTYLGFSEEQIQQYRDYQAIQLTNEEPDDAVPIHWFGSLVSHSNDYIVPPSQQGSGAARELNHAVQYPLRS